MVANALRSASASHLSKHHHRPGHPRDDGDGARAAAPGASTRPKPLGTDRFLPVRRHAGAGRAAGRPDHRLGIHPPRHARPDRPHPRRPTACSASWPIPLPDKRAKLIDELLASPQWVDKWTMYFGDLYQNTDSRPSTSLRRFPARTQRLLLMDPRFAGRRQAVQPDGDRADHRHRCRTATPRAS